MGLPRVKKDTVADPVRLEDEGDPVAQDSEDGVPDDKKIKTHAKLRCSAIP